MTTIPRQHEIKFWEAVDVGDCWLWTRGCTSAGYGQVWLGHKKPVYAHRFAYELLVGPIPEKASLDHLCRVTRCVNPDHLQPVSQRENVLRGYGLAALRAKATHCKHGHEFDEANTLDRGGYRVCRRCRNIRTARARGRL